MAVTIIRFLNILFAALVAGTIFGIWIGYNPSDLSSLAYVEQQQNFIRALNVLMPILGLITILLTLLSAFLQRNVKPVFTTLLIGAAFLIVSGLITRFGNQPINSIVITWNANSPPTNWTEFRDRWWSLHIMRVLSSITALCLITWAGIRKN